MATTPRLATLRAAPSQPSALARSGIGQHPAAASRAGRTLEEVRAASHATIPAGRYGTVAEFAATAAFLCSGPASYVTGSLVRCDWGLIRLV